MRMFDIEIVKLASSNFGSQLHMLVSVDQQVELVVVSIPTETASLLSVIMTEDPFPKRKTSQYSYHLISCCESTKSKIKSAEVEIRKGKSRTKRSLTISRQLYILLWNLFHFRTIPRLFPAKTRE